MSNLPTGKRAELLVREALLKQQGVRIYLPEVDDNGVDVLIELNGKEYIELQIKSLTAPGYVFMTKREGKGDEIRYLALVLFFGEKNPSVYLIPPDIWKTPNDTFVDRKYENLKSSPEWGINVSKRSLSDLDKYGFEKQIELLRRLE